MQQQLNCNQSEINMKSIWNDYEMDMEGKGKVNNWCLKSLRVPCLNMDESWLRNKPSRRHNQQQQELYQPLLDTQQKLMQFMHLKQQQVMHKQQYAEIHNSSRSLSQVNSTLILFVCYNSKIIVHRFLLLFKLKRIS